MPSTKAAALRQTDAPMTIETVQVRPLAPGANAPRVLLAEELTGNLDVHTADVVFEELLATVRRERLAALIATHNPDLAARMDRIVALRDGKALAVATRSTSEI